mgnify:CR=1 FL=1
MSELHVNLTTLFNPYRQQARVLAAEHRYILFLAGIGAGKTYTGAIWAVQHMLFWSEGFRGAILGRTEKKDAMDQLAGRVLALLDAWHEVTGIQMVRKFDKLNNILTLYNGSSAVFRGFVQYDKLRGPEYAWAWLDELFFAGVDDGAAFDVVDGRVRVGSSKQLLITCSPRGVTPVIRRFGSAQERAELPDADPCRYFVVRATSYDNPHLDRNDISAWREGMSRRRAAQEIDGEILKPEHIVWPELEDRHFVDFDWRTKEHQEWPWVLAIDWGDTKGSVALDIRVNPKTKQWVVADELVPQSTDLPDGRLNTAKFRVLLDTWLKRRRRKPTNACADRAVVSENAFLRRLIGGESHVLTLESHTEQRINNGIEMLRDAFDPPTGQPRIVFARSLASESRGETPGIVPAVRNFQWEVDAAGFPKPVVRDDEHKHACDALRYGWVGCRRDQRLHHVLPALYGLGPDGYAEAGDGQHSKRDRW